MDVLEEARELPHGPESGYSDKEKPAAGKLCYQTATTMLSVAAHKGQTKVRKSKPGSSGSRRERIIGVSQSAQNGCPVVALPWKEVEGTERLSMALPLVRREYKALSHR